METEQRHTNGQEAEADFAQVRKEAIEAIKAAFDRSVISSSDDGVGIFDEALLAPPPKTIAVPVPLAL